MKRRKPLPVPQHEFGFAATTFNLIQETGIDGERVAQERNETERNRMKAEVMQDKIFPDENALLIAHSDCQRKCQQTAVTSGERAMSEYA